MDKKIRTDEEVFRRIFENSNDAIFVIDPEEDAILDANARASAMLGYAREELLNLPISAIHPSEMPALLAFARSVRREGQGWTNELTCRTKAGQTLAAEISASIVDVDGRQAVIAFVRDVSDRKRAEEALQIHLQTLEEEVQRRTARLREAEHRQRVLLQINNAIIANLERGSLFHSVVETLQTVRPFDAAVICVHDPEKDVFRMFALEGLAAQEEILPVGTEMDRHSHIGWVFDHQRPLRRGDLRVEGKLPLEQSVFATGIRSSLIVPLVARGSVIGTLNLGSKEPDHFTEEDEEFVAEVATQIALAVQNMLAYEEIDRLKDRLARENIYLQEEIKTEHNFEEIVGHSPALKRVLREVEMVAPTDAAVLVIGETGTGKELIARAIHGLSSRRKKPCIKVNCAAIPSGLVESELFGHERGAFTGAISRKIGRFELADGGTLFLDEIGDLSADVQAKLLRALQEQEFERVGGSQTHKVDVRIIAATNRDLELAMGEGRFRSDLFYRLSVFPIRVPPLRERREDIPMLVRYFVQQCSVRTGKRIDKIPRKTMDGLVAYRWPGNIRELQNVIERAVILSQGSLLELAEWVPSRESGDPSSPPRILTLEEMQRQHIRRALELTGWRVSGEWGAASLLGMKPTTLESRMKKLGIHRPEGEPHDIS